MKSRSTCALLFGLMMIQGSLCAQVIVIGSDNSPEKFGLDYWRTVSETRYARLGDFVISPSCETIKFSQTEPPVTVCSPAIDRSDVDPPWHDGDWSIWAAPLTGSEDLIVNAEGRTNWNNLIELEIQAPDFPFSDHFHQGDVIHVYGWHVEDCGHSVMGSSSLFHTGCVLPITGSTNVNGGKTELHPIIYVQKGALEDAHFELFTAQDGSGRFPLADRDLTDYFAGWSIPLGQTPASVSVYPLQSGSQTVNQDVFLLREQAQVDVHLHMLSLGNYTNHYFTDTERRFCWHDRQSNIPASQTPGAVHFQPQLRGVWFHDAHYGLVRCLQPLYYGDFDRSTEQLLSENITSHLEPLSNGYQAMVADVTATLRSPASFGDFVQTEWRYQDATGTHNVENPAGNTVTLHLKYSPSEGLNTAMWGLQVMASRQPVPGWAAEDVTARQDIGPDYAIAGDPTAFRVDVASHHVYARNQNGDLVHYYWSADAWGGENLTARASIGTTYRMGGDPVVMCTQCPGGAQHVYARAMNSDLIHYAYSVSGGWTAEDVTSRLASTVGFQLGGDPVALYNIPAQHLFANNGAGHLIHYSQPQGHWTAEDLTVLASSTFRLQGQPLGLYGVDGLIHVWVRSDVGDLIHYRQTTAGWAAQDLTTLPGIGAAFRFEGAAVAVVGTDGVIHVLARNTMGQLLHYHDHAGLLIAWAAENVTNLPTIGSSYLFQGELALPALWPMWSSAELDVYARNPAGEVIHYHWVNATGWSAENLTTRQNVGAQYQIAGTPVAFQGIGAGGGLHVYARNGIGDLIHYVGNSYGSAGLAWSAENLSSLPSTGSGYRIASDPGPPILDAGASHHIYARNANGHLIHYFWLSAPEPTSQLGLGSPHTRVFAQAAVSHFVTPTSITLNVHDHATDLCADGFDVQAVVSQAVPGSPNQSLEWKVAQVVMSSGAAVVNPVFRPVGSDGAVLQLDGATAQRVGDQLRVRFTASKAQLQALARVPTTVLGENPVATVPLSILRCVAGLAPNIASRWKDLEKAALAIVRLKQLGLWNGHLSPPWPPQFLQAWGDGRLTDESYPWLPAEAKRLVDSYQRLANNQAVANTEVQDLVAALSAASQLPDLNSGAIPTPDTPKGLSVSAVQGHPFPANISEVFVKPLQGLEANRAYVAPEIEFDDRDGLSGASVAQLVRWSVAVRANPSVRIELAYAARTDTASQARALRRVTAVKEILVGQGVDPHQLTIRAISEAGVSARGRFEIRRR